MPYRTNPLARAVYGSSLAAAVVFGANWAASAAGGCIAKPNEQIDQAGHWYYHVDRMHHRRCWFFETSEATTSSPSSPAPVSSQNADSPSLWFSRLAEGLAQTFSDPQKQNTAVDELSTVTKATSPRHPKIDKIARKERPQIAPLPETTGRATAKQGDQLGPQPTAERNEVYSTAADREALFQEFLRWYMDRAILGPP
jgi:hypothetical protein